jgi:hypothetical protein
MYPTTLIDGILALEKDDAVIIDSCYMVGLPSIKLNREIDGVYKTLCVYSKISGLRLEI